MREHTPLPMRIEDYAAAKGIKTKHQPCPFCGNRSSFSINVQKQVFNCLSTNCPSNANGKHGGNVITMCSLLEGCTTKEAYRILADMAGKPLSSSAMAIKTKDRETIESDSDLASIELRNLVYLSLIRHLPLDDKHKQDLTKRGFDCVTGYRTYDFKSEEDRVRVCNLVIKDCMDKIPNFTLRGIPGFYINKDGNWTLSYSKRAILVPYFDDKYRIQGMQLRKDSKVLKQDENKYVWFSSSYLPKGSVEGSGTRARTFVHFATFKRTEVNGKRRVIHFFNDGVCFLTEGAMKADLAHALTGEAFIAVPGVNALTKLSEALDILKGLGVTTIVNAYDMDYLTNKNVADAVTKTQDIILSKGFDYHRLMWNTKAHSPKDGENLLKGVDDYYAFKVKGIRP